MSSEKCSDKCSIGDNCFSSVNSVFLRFSLRDRPVVVLTAFQSMRASAGM